MKKFFCFSLVLVLSAFVLSPVKAQPAQISSDPPPEYSFLSCRTGDSVLEATFQVFPEGIEILGFEHYGDNQPFGFRGTFNSFVEQQGYFSLPVQIEPNAKLDNSPITFVPRSGPSNYIEDLRINYRPNSSEELVVAEIDENGTRSSRRFMNCQVRNLALIKRSISDRSLNAYSCQCVQTSGNRMALSVPFTSLIDQTKKLCRLGRSGGELTCEKL